MMLKYFFLLLFLFLGFNGFSQKDKLSKKELKKAKKEQEVKKQDAGVMHGTAKDTTLALDPDSMKLFDPDFIPPVSDTAGPGYAEIIQDYRLKELMDRQKRINDSLGTISGFRVQIWFGGGPGSKTKAREFQSEFLKVYPDVPSYTPFDPPNHRVRVGDFRTRLEAEKFHQLIKDQFPSSFIVRDNINLPPLKE